MNIFVFDQSPVQSALWLDDVRKNKMITETCQIISTVMNELDPNHRRPVYKSFNPKHGSIQWAMRSSGNCDWLLNYLNALLDQRGVNANGNPHGCTDLIRNHFPKWLSTTKCFALHEQTKFSNNAANADVGVSFKHISNPILAYRMYINKRWEMDTIQLSWKFGQEPKWRLKK